MANPPKPWKAEYAKSSRSSCKTCKSPIQKETFRLGKMVQATQFDGFMPMWNHASCILAEAKQIGFTDDVEGLESLRWEDQQKIKKYVDEGVQSSSSKASGYSIFECGIEVSSTSRATCRSCNDKIMKEEIRISTKPEGQNARSLAWHHAKCYLDASSNAQVETFAGWHNLSASEHETLLSLAKKNPSTSKGTYSEQKDETGPLLASTTEGGLKRKNAVESDQKSKLARSGDVSSSVLENQLELQE